MSKVGLEKHRLVFQEKLLNVLLENPNSKNIDTYRKENKRKRSPKIRLQYLTYSFDNKSNLRKKCVETDERNEKNERKQKVRRVGTECKNYISENIKQNKDLKNKEIIQIKKEKKRAKILKATSDKKRAKLLLECATNIKNLNYNKGSSRNRSMDKNLRSLNYTNFICYLTSLKALKKDFLLKPNHSKIDQLSNFEKNRNYNEKNKINNFVKLNQNHNLFKNPFFIDKKNFRNRLTPTFPENVKSFHKFRNKTNSLIKIISISKGHKTMSKGSQDQFDSPFKFKNKFKNANNYYSSQLNYIHSKENYSKTDKNYIINSKLKKIIEKND